ncbi:Rieske (2Fe-2S) protein [Nocardioides zeicaulis]|uniref:Rieske (2Fe-2S) protein n=1 Tax=Nocardioides zeicaulis TaxID=1776857 RepID=A0ABV6E2S5_9ACTN
MDTQSQFETIHDGDLGAPVLDVVQEAVDAASITYARTPGTDVEQTLRAELRSRGVRARSEATVHALADRIRAGGEVSVGHHDGSVGLRDPDTTVAAADLPPGAVRRVGSWAVGNRDGELFAVSRRCRHQLADLSEGTIDADGCLVCPWHQARYDVTNGEMVTGPRGFFGYHGPTPGYTELVRGYARVLRLRVADVVRRGADLVVVRRG